MNDLVIESLANLGAAGVVGLLWVWERANSRRRERQLDQTHRQLLDRHHDVQVLVRLIQRNTIAMTRIDQTHQRLCRIIERWIDRPDPGEDQGHR